MFRADAACTGNFRATGVPVLESEARQFFVTGTAFGMLVGPVCIYEERVFHGTGIYKHNSTIRAHELGSRRLLWSWDFGIPSVKASEHRAITAGPGIVLVLNADRALLLLDAETGLLRWEQPAVAGNATPIVVKNTVFHPTNEGLFAIDLRSAQRSCVYETTQDEMCSSPAFADGVLYFRDGDGCLVAFDLSSSTLRWKREIAACAFVSIANDLVLVGCETQQRYTTFAFERTNGATRWSVSDAGIFPTVCGEIVCVGAGNDVLGLALRSGEERWRTSLEADCTVLAAASEQLYVGCSDGSLVSLDVAMGQERWRSRSFDGSIVDLAVGNGCLVVGADPLSRRTNDDEALFANGDPLFQVSEEISAVYESRNRDKEASTLHAWEAEFAREVEAVVASFKNPQEAWEALSARGLIAPWKPQHRSFASSQEWRKRFEHPATMLDVEFFALRSSMVPTAEALAFEAMEALAMWGASRSSNIVWSTYFWDYTNTQFPGVSSILAALYVQLDAASIAELTRNTLPSLLHGEDQRGVRASLKVYQSLWELAVQRKLRVPESAPKEVCGKLFAELPNPFLPLIELRLCDVLLLRLDAQELELALLVAPKPQKEKDHPIEDGLPF